MQRLLEDAQALPHLLHPDAVAVIAVADLAGGDIELEAVVNGIRVGLAQVPLDAAGAEHRAADAAVDGQFLRQNADALGAGEQISFLLEQTVVFCQDVTPSASPVLRNGGQELLGDVLADAADAHVVVGRRCPLTISNRS